MGNLNRERLGLLTVMCPQFFREPGTVLYVGAYDRRFWGSGVLDGRRAMGRNADLFLTATASDVPPDESEPTITADDGTPRAWASANSVSTFLKVEVSDGGAWDAVVWDEGAWDATIWDDP